MYSFDSVRYQTTDPEEMRAELEYNLKLFKSLIVIIVKMLTEIASPQEPRQTDFFHSHHSVRHHPD